MKRNWLLSLCLLLILGGCGRGPIDGGGRGLPGGAAAERGTPETLKAVLVCDGEETVLKTLNAPAEHITVEPFVDILGSSGFRLTERQGLAVQNPEEDWSLRTYFALEDGSARQIAESFGWGPPQDYSVNLDREGTTELVSNVTYGGDGRQDTYIYQRREGGIWLGRIRTDNLPDRDDRGAASVGVVYDAERDVFVIRYLSKSTGEPVSLESRGLERVEFAPYEK